jgi:ATP-dependent helicase HrpB
VFSTDNDCLVDPLPIDGHLDAILEHVRSARAAVVIASPGAGKTTRVPPALAADGPVLLLQPRRVGARAIARRIADERGWTVGREVGWHVRFDRRSSRETQLLVATEGILTARLQHDPLLSAFRTVIIDEFHERSIHADIGLALARQAWMARPDLRLVVMSATLDATAVAAFLGGCPVIDVPGRTFPLEIGYRPGVPIERAVVEALSRTTGALLCFLPGAPEIRRAADALSAMPQLNGIPILPLHGGLDGDEQEAAIRPSRARRVILATNIAETTLTVPDVTCVIDTGLHKLARYDPERAIDSLDTERVSQDSADQRAGRAGRTQAGVVLRLWASHDRLRPHREPEIARVDLAGPALDILAWGGDPRSFEWFEIPRRESLDAALHLLGRLGAVDAAGQLTPVGRDLQRLPLHPRLGRMLLAAAGAPEIGRACALLSERRFVPPRHGTTSCDVLAAVDREQALPPHILRVAQGIRDAARDVLGSALADRIDDIGFRHAVLEGYPDRVARRRAAQSDRLLMCSGTGARLARESGVHNPEFLVAVDVTAGTGTGAEALVRLATGIDRAWLVPTAREIVHEFDAARGIVKAARVERYGDLSLNEHPCAPDPEQAAAIIAREYVRRGPTLDDVRLQRRLAFSGAVMTFESLVGAATHGKKRLDDVDLEARLPPETRRELDRDAPNVVKIPGGRNLRLDYHEDGRVSAAVKLQEVFGLEETPRIGPRRVPVTLELLAPNGRPVQVTSDLRSFWARGYPEVRRALQARYPKHRWE